MTKQSIEDSMNIAKAKAKHYPFHPLYPQRDDYVQNAMLNLVKDKGAEGFENKSIHYSHLSTYERQFKRECARPDKTDIDNIKPKSYETLNDIMNKIEVKRFFDWLPTEYLKDMFKMKMEGYEMTEIAKKYSYSRQQMYNIMNKQTKKYRDEINGRV